MEDFKIREDVCGLAWKINNPKAIIVISHGMAEHVSRYDKSQPN